MPSEESIWLAINSVRWYVHFLVIVIGGGGFTLAFYFYPEDNFSVGFHKTLIAVYSILLLFFAIYIPTTFPIDGAGLDSFPLILSFNFASCYTLLFVVWFIGGGLITYILRVVYVGLRKIIKMLTALANSDEF